MICYFPQKEAHPIDERWFRFITDVMEPKPAFHIANQRKYFNAQGKTGIRVKL